MNELSYEKPEVRLTGEDGNAFFILGKVRKAMVKAGASSEELDGFMKKATNGDYDNLLVTCMEYVDVL